MRITWAFLTALLSTSVAYADAPEYNADPFGDSELSETPLILNVAYPSFGRGEAALLFSGSMIDKYSSHMGGLLDFTYHVTETLGAGLTVGFLSGNLTTIVTDGEGIIGNKMDRCLQDANLCENINPNVPDYKQMTGMVGLNAIWSPLYGKINVVSELDVSLQLYGLFGVGMNGTRQVTATARSARATAMDYDLAGEAFGDGGFFNDPHFNFTAGGGLKLYLLDWLALRAEIRGVMFLDEFVFDEKAETYLSRYWFSNFGASFTLF